MTRAALAALPRPQLDDLAAGMVTPWALPRWVVVEFVIHRDRLSRVASPPPPPTTAAG